ncbi:MAG: hypothetical protein ABSC92_13440 [Rhizomicrobium sp.]|jgi:hypothetical protein
MNKIPVGETISGAYSFAFTKILSVLGVFWLPYLIAAAIIAAAVHFFAPDLPHQLVNGPWDLSLAMNFQHISGILVLVGTIAASMVTVGLQRKALGLHPGPVFFFFSLGAPVWLMIGAFILAFLVILLIGGITAGLCVAIWFAAGNIGSPAAAGGVRALAIIAAACWIIYLEVRLLFFLPAVVVAENSIGLGRSWTLGGGNFWRIIVVLIVVFLPVAIGFGMISQALVGPFLPNFEFLSHQPQDPHMFINLLMRQFRVLGPLYLVFALVERIVFWGLGNGAIATAYRHVVPSGTAADHG